MSVRGVCRQDAVKAFTKSHEILLKHQPSSAASVGTSLAQMGTALLHADKPEEADKHSRYNVFTFGGSQLLLF